MDILNVSDLRKVYGNPTERAAAKTLHKLDVHCQKFIELSPFCILGTAGSDGSSDCSPRGDAPGFVRIINDKTLFLPDRRGNNRVDSMSNILENPNIAVIFLVPGMNETLRISGKASIVTNDAILSEHLANGKKPKTGLIIDVKEAFLHCAKALMRSHLWDPSHHIDRKSFPTLRTILREQTGLDAPEVTENYYRSRLY